MADDKAVRAYVDVSIQDSILRELLEMYMPEKHRADALQSLRSRIEIAYRDGLRAR